MFPIKAIIPLSPYTKRPRTNLSFILPNLIIFLKKLNTSSWRLNGRAHKLAELLSSLHQNECPYTELPKYEYHQLKKRITCKLCHSFSTVVNGRKISCNECDFEEDVETAVVRSVKELQLLFPEKKITTNLVQDWCQVIDSQIRITRILKKNFKAIGYGQWTYYE